MSNSQNQGQGIGYGQQNQSWGESPQNLSGLPQTGGFPPPQNRVQSLSPFDQPQPPYGYSQPQPYGYSQPQQPFGYGQSYYNGGQGAGALAMLKGGFWIRFVAFIIDYIVLCIVLFGLTALFGIVAASTRSTGASVGISLLLFLLYILTFPAYYVVTSLIFEGATLGKKVVGLKVVDEAGNIPGTGTFILRYTIGYWISAIIIYIGFIMIGFDAYKQGLHDKIAKTYVVYKNQPGIPRAY